MFWVPCWHCTNPCNTSCIKYKIPTADIQAVFFSDTVWWNLETQNHIQIWSYFMTVKGYMGLQEGAGWALTLCPWTAFLTISVRDGWPQHRKPTGKGTGSEAYIWYFASNLDRRSVKADMWNHWLRQTLLLPLIAGTMRSERGSLGLRSRSYPESFTHAL